MYNRNKTRMTYERRAGKNYVKITGDAKDIVKLAWFDRIATFFSMFTWLISLKSILPDTLISWWTKFDSKS
jgi:hypothetical protein